MSAVWTVLQKEVIDNLRDRRSVTNALTTVLLNPLLFIILFGFIGRTFSEKAERPLQLPVVGAENAPALIAYLRQNNADILPAPDDPETALREGTADVVLLIPDDYAETFSDGQPVIVELLSDDTNDSAELTADRARTLIQRYSAQLGNLRLLARGISPTITSPVVVQDKDINQQRGQSETLTLLPTIMLVAAFFGGFYLASDTTAGERERESLEPLLVNPVPRWQIVLGKLGAVFLFTLVAMIVATVVYVGLLAVPQLQSFIGLRIELDLSVIWQALLLMLPVVLMAVGLEVFLASFARSNKEAQTYVTYLSLAGFMPAMMLSVLPVRSQAWMTIIPSISQTVLIQKLTRGEALETQQVIIATAVTLVVAVVAVLGAIHLYNQERIVSSS